MTPLIIDLVARYRLVVTSESRPQYLRKFVVINIAKEARWTLEPGLSLPLPGMETDSVQ